MTTRQHYRTNTAFDACVSNEVLPLNSPDREACWDNFTQVINTTCSHRVIEYAKDIFDGIFPLQEGSHQKATTYLVYYDHLLVTFADGSITGLRNPNQFIASNGSKSEPSSITLRHQNSQIEVCFDRNGDIGINDLANIDNISSIESNTTLATKEEVTRFIKSQKR